ncbi:MAG: hypothetical protein AABY22_21335, partial [Nanoarchaeota archaeon]
FPNHEIVIYLFGDKEHYELKLSNRISLIIIPTKHAPWPASTLFRYRMFTNSAEKMKICDHVAYLDVDMILVGDVADEIFDGDPDIIFTRHPGFFNNSNWGSQNVNTASNAYLEDNLKERYVAGGFNLGKADKFLEMSRILADNIDDDYRRGIICEHNDEAHTNCFANKIVKYEYSNWKIKYLTPSYCMITDKEARIKFGLEGLPAIIYCIEKNHEELRK